MKPDPGTFTRPKPRYKDRESKYGVQIVRRKSALTTTENDLQDHFGQAGSVIAVNIMQDRATGRSRGFAFVEMGSQEDANKAIQCFTRRIFRVVPSRSMRLARAKSARAAAAVVVAVATAADAAVVVADAAAAAAMAADEDATAKKDLFSSNHRSQTRTVVYFLGAVIGICRDSKCRVDRARLSP